MLKPGSFDSRQISKPDIRTSNSQKSEMVDAAAKRNHSDARIVVIATEFMLLICDSWSMSAMGRKRTFGFDRVAPAGSGQT